MKLSNYGICGISGLIVITLLIISGCGDSKPDRIEVNPVEKTMEIGANCQFTATAWLKNKKLSGQSFTWQVEGDAGTIDDRGRFTARKPGEVAILAKTGGMIGKGKAIVKEKPVLEPTVKQEAKTDKTDLSVLQPVIVLSGQDFGEPKKGPVTFSHLKHINDYGAICIDCHHQYENGKNVWKPGDPVEECAACHDPDETRGEVMKLQNAFHRNCRNCHKQAVEEGRSESAPYKKCSDCHGG